MGHPLLREKLAAHYTPAFKPALGNRDLDPNKELLVTVGACGALFCAVHHLVEEGDEVVTFEPFYSIYINYIDFAGAKARTVGMHTNEKGEW